MKKTVILTVLFFVCVFIVSCNNESESLPKDFTYKQAAEYLSSLDGLFQLGYDYYRQPDPHSTEPYFTGWYSIPVKDNTVYINKFAIYYKTVDYYGSSSSILLETVRFEELLCIKHPERFHQISIFDQYSINEDAMRLGVTHDNIGYLFERYNVKTSPSWTEWIEYNIPYHHHSNRICSNGKNSAFWVNPMTEKLEEVIYIRELDNKTEIYEQLLP